MLDCFRSSQSVQQIKSEIQIKTKNRKKSSQIKILGIWGATNYRGERSLGMLGWCVRVFRQ